METNIMHFTCIQRASFVQFIYEQIYKEKTSRMLETIQNRLKDTRYTRHALNLHRKRKSIHVCQLQDVNTFEKEIHTKLTTACSTACVWMCVQRANVELTKWPAEWYSMWTCCQVSLHFPFQQKKQSHMPPSVSRMPSPSSPQCPFYYILSP